MRSVDQNITQRAIDQMGESPVSDDDIELVVRAGVKLLGQGGMDIIKNAIDTSADPAQVIGQFMAQLILKMGEEFVEQLRLDPRAFLAKGGFLEELLDYIEQKLGLPSEFSDRVYSETVEVIKAVVVSRQARPAAEQRPGLEQAGGLNG